MSPTDTLRNGNWLTNIIIGALVGALITAAVSVVSFGRNMPTRDEVVKIVKEQSPYTKEKSGIDARLKNIESMLTEIRQELREERKVK